MPDSLARFWSPCALVLTAALAVGCSSSGATPGTPGSAGSGGSAGAGGSGGMTGSPDTKVGGFSVRLVPAVPGNVAYTDFVGVVKDGAEPVGVIMKAVEEANGCRLRTPRVPFCNTPCGADVCVDDNKCAGYPKKQNLGVVKAKGLGNAEFSMEFMGGNYQPAAEVKLPFPPCAEGAEVKVETSGGAYAPFSLTSKGIAPLVVAGSGPLPLNPNQPLKLEWTPPGTAGASRMLIRVDISHHGGLKGEIECDVADNGMLEIPASMVTKLIALGTAGFPTAYLTRASIGSVAIQPGRVTLEISSAVERPLSVAGVISCNEDSECPPGKTCLQDRTCSK